MTTGQHYSQFSFKHVLLNSRVIIVLSQDLMHAYVGETYFLGIDFTALLMEHFRYERHVNPQALVSPNGFQGKVANAARCCLANLHLPWLALFVCRSKQKHFL